MFTAGTCFYMCFSIAACPDRGLSLLISEKGIQNADPAEKSVWNSLGGCLKWRGVTTSCGSWNPQMCVATTKTQGELETEPCRDQIQSYQKDASYIVDHLCSEHNDQPCWYSNIISCFSDGLTQSTGHLSSNSILSFSPRYIANIYYSVRPKPQEDYQGLVEN